jgi:hypothetical protein
MVLPFPYYIKYNNTENNINSSIQLVEHEYINSKPKKKRIQGQGITLQTQDIY